VSIQGIRAAAAARSAFASVIAGTGTRAAARAMNCLRLSGTLAKAHSHIRFAPEIGRHRRGTMRRFGAARKTSAAPSTR
jgi:hypothetical protein